MFTVEDFCQFFESFAPLRLAEDWDNVGLLVGDRSQSVNAVMTCLTVTPESVDEAIREKANLIVAHHPLPFRPLKRITADQQGGKLLLQLIANGIAVYSPHTSFDSCLYGINQQLADGLGLKNVNPLQLFEADADGLGSGRYGELGQNTSLADFVHRVKSFLGVQGLHCVGDHKADISRVAVACGSAGQFLSVAARSGCDCLLTGETNFHTCLEAKARGVSLVLPGHFASERFAIETLSDRLQKEFSGIQIWPSSNEVDPLRWV